MNETVPTKQDIGIGKHVLSKIELDETAAFRELLLLIGLDDRPDDIATDVLDTIEINALHPGEIATGDIEQDARVELTERLWKLLSQHSGRVETRAGARSRLRIRPEVGVIDPLESFLQAEFAQLCFLLGESSFGDSDSSLAHPIYKVVRQLTRAASRTAGSSSDAPAAGAPGAFFQTRERRPPARGKRPPRGALWARGRWRPPMHRPKHWGPPPPRTAWTGKRP